MSIAAIPHIAISEKKLSAIIGNGEKTAAAAKLLYVHDSQPGITRCKTGKGFSYFHRGKKITDKSTLNRILSLVIPPAWQGVWICASPDGHLQVTGLDAKKRKQYRYHPAWNVLRNQTKFHHMIQFAKVLPAIRSKVEQDLALPGLPHEKVMALIVKLMEKTHIRIGNNFYEQVYGSFGLTTLKTRHVSITGNELRFFFKGKKGIEHSIRLRSKRLASLVKQCREIPGKELFQYFDDNGIKKPVDSGMVNEYIKQLTEADFTAKDFRTWAGTIDTFICFKELGIPETAAARKKNIIAVLDTVAEQLGNTRNVCKKYYVHPAIIDMYQSGLLEKYFKLPACDAEKTVGPQLSKEEQCMIKILEGYQKKGN
ncbi:DNA topoisomerase IB [Ferruginibacter profundus]